MKWPYKEGTRVRITKYGFEMYMEGRSNPRNIWGTVTESQEITVEVDWHNGCKNCYREGTLEPKPIALENK